MVIATREGAVGVAVLKGVRADRPIALGIVAIAVALFAINNTWTSQIAWGVPAVLLVLGTASLEGVALFKSKLLQFLGEASYATYLTHPFLVWGANWAAGGRKSDILAVIAFFVSILLGALVHLWIEAPMLRYMRNISFGRYWPKFRNSSADAAMSSRGEARSPEKIQNKA